MKSLCSIISLDFSLFLQVWEEMVTFLTKTPKRHLFLLFHLWALPSFSACFHGKQIRINTWHQYPIAW